MPNLEVKESEHTPLIVETGTVEEELMEVWEAAMGAMEVTKDYQ